jgi:sigma-B regulation protein RsbU (phosphoserine phosphatase)
MNDHHHMQCMEVWGGNQHADRGVVMAGLDAWVYSKPYGGADGGGDVYYVSSCATGRITRLLVADVSGHGAAVCDIAGQLRTMMRKHVNQIDQSRFVQSMNRQFAALSGAGCFATALVTTFFAPTNSLSLCNAGHPPPLIYRAATKQWSFLDQKSATGDAFANVPLGIIDLVNYDQFDVRLKVGDLVICYTDSLIEARDAAGEMLGTSGLLEIAQALDVSDPTRLISQLLAAVRNWCNQDICEDDVTVLLFRPNGLAPATPVREKLLAPFRIMKSFLMSLCDQSHPAALPELSIANIGGALFAPLSRWRSTAQPAYGSAKLSTAPVRPATRPVAPAPVVPAMASAPAPVPAPVDAVDPERVNFEAEAVY